MLCLKPKLEAVPMPFKALPDGDPKISVSSFGSGSFLFIIPNNRALDSSGGLVPDSRGKGQVFETVREKSDGGIEPHLTSPIHGLI